MLFVTVYRWQSIDDWCWSWNSNTLATWCEELTHLNRPWCWERLKAGGEGDNRRWDGWMSSPTQWTWVWVGSANWRWTGKPGVLQSMGLQRVGHDWDWTDYIRLLFPHEALSWNGFWELKCQVVSLWALSSLLSVCCQHRPNVSSNK